MTEQSRRDYAAELFSQMDTGPAVMDLVAARVVRVRDTVITTVLIRRAPFLKKIGTTIQRIQTGVKGGMTILDIFFSGTRVYSSAKCSRAWKDLQMVW